MAPVAVNSWKHGPGATILPRLSRASPFLVLSMCRTMNTMLVWLVLHLLNMTVVGPCSVYGRTFLRNMAIRPFLISPTVLPLTRLTWSMRSLRPICIAG